MANVLQTTFSNAPLGMNIAFWLKLCWQDLIIDGKSSLGQVLAGAGQVPSHYLNQGWLSSLMCVIRPQRVKLIKWLHAKHSGPWCSIKMSSYQYRKSHYGDKTIMRPCYLHNGISDTGKIISLYLIRHQNLQQSRTCNGFALTLEILDIPTCMPRHSDTQCSLTADSRFAASQWATSLQSNAVSHWLGSN